jgi:uncharacterized protein YqgC (DUF456 family)
MMTTSVIILGLIVSLLGVVGCVMPFIPGPPLSFLALIILSAVRNWEPFSPTFLIIMAGITAGVTISDYLMPISGARRYGASKLGTWGLVIGMFTGLLLFPPWGIMLGGVVGALGGELLAGKRGKQVLRAGWGVIIGNVVATGLKLALSGAMLFFYVREMFS